MVKKKMNLNSWVKYVIFSYLLFWTMVLVLGGSAAMIFKVSPTTMRFIALLCAWAPTFALLIMYKKLMPDESFGSFLRRNFKPKIDISLALISGGLVAIGVISSVLIFAIIQGNDFNIYFSLKGYSLIAAILFSVFAGPTGEELGWRGYLRVELDKRYSFVKASFLGGLIWAFWHGILWAVDGDFMGMNLVLYIISNVVVMTSIVIIMNVVLKKSGNILNAVWIHLCFNFPYSFIQNEGIEFYVIMTLVFPLIAIIFFKLFYVNNKEEITN